MATPTREELNELASDLGNLGPAFWAGILDRITDDAREQIIAALDEHSFPFHEDAAIQSCEDNLERCMGCGEVTEAWDDRGLCPACQDVRYCLVCGAYSTRLDETRVCIFCQKNAGHA